MAHLTLAEAITASFYAWETRGRGWTLAEYPVQLEPPHRPFFLLPEYGGHGAIRTIDDGHRPTIGSRLSESIRSLFAPNGADGSANESEHSESFEEEPPYPADERSPLAAIRLILPVEYETSHDLAARLLLSLTTTREPLAWEVVGYEGIVELQLVAGEDDVPHVLSTLAAYYPAIQAEIAEDLLVDDAEGEESTAVVDFGLESEFFLPLRVDDRPAIDPYASLLAAMAQCGDGETLAFQVLIERVRNPWSKTIHAAVSDGKGGSSFDDAPEFPKLAAEKLQSPLVAAVVRVYAHAADHDRTLALIQRVEAFLAQWRRADGNALVPLCNDEYPNEVHEVAFLRRESFRTGMLLAIDELVGLAHVPDSALNLPVLVRDEGSSHPAPTITEGHELILGANIHRGTASLVTLPEEARYSHVHVVGATGTGKSTLLLNLITQDIASGHGIAVFDPHGDLIDDILVRIPESRVEDVILFDPSDEEYPVGFGFFTATSDIERNLIASDTVAVFQRLATSWGDAMTAVLGNAVHAMLASPSSATLIDLRRFLIDDGFRKSFLAEISDEELRFFWEREFGLIGSRSIGPILTRLDTFLRPRLIRNIVGQRGPRLMLNEVIAGQKILLVKLSQGLIGEENAALLGSLLVTKLHQSAIARQGLKAEERSPFFCYLDEFQHFVTPSIASLLSEGRKYRMGLILAHQSLAQLEGSKRVEAAVLGNAYTRVGFRVDDGDAKRLAGGFAHFEADDLTRLERGDAIVRFGSSANDCNVHCYPPPEEGALPLVETIRESSRKQYGRPRSQVDADTAPPVVTTQETIPEPVAPVTSVDSSPVTEPTITPAPKKLKPRPDIPEPPRDLGKGGQEHKYLQHLVKRLAEERGFRAIVEADVGDGRSIDVLLRRDDVTVACEISVTTESDHELENIGKCATLGYSRILFISGSKRKRDQVMRRVTEIHQGIPLLALPPEEIVAALETLDVPPTTEAIVRGYKVKVKRQIVSPQDVAERRGAVAAVVARSLAKGAPRG